MVNIVKLTLRWEPIPAPLVEELESLGLDEVGVPAESRIISEKENRKGKVKEKSHHGSRRDPQEHAWHTGGIGGFFLSEFFIKKTLVRKLAPLGTTPPNSSEKKYTPTRNDSEISEGVRDFRKISEISEKVPKSPKMIRNLQKGPKSPKGSEISERFPISPKMIRNPRK